jgi:hypothetical protein
VVGQSNCRRRAGYACISRESRRRGCAAAGPLRRGLGDSHISVHGTWAACHARAPANDRQLLALLRDEDRRVHKAAVDSAGELADRGGAAAAQGHDSRQDERDVRSAHDLDTQSPRDADVKRAAREAPMRSAARAQPRVARRGDAAAIALRESYREQPADRPAAARGAGAN